MGLWYGQFLHSKLRSVLIFEFSGKFFLQWIDRVPQRENLCIFALTWVRRSATIYLLLLIKIYHNPKKHIHFLAESGTRKEKTTDNRFLRLPLARIKHIMKVDPDVSIISQECAVLVTKATELFIESLAREAFVHTAQAKKKTIQKKDVDMAISTVDALMFLEGAMNF